MYDFLIGRNCSNSSIRVEVSSSLPVMHLYPKFISSDSLVPRLSSSFLSLAVQKALDESLGTRLTQAYPNSREKVWV